MCVRYPLYVISLAAKEVIFGQTYKIQTGDDLPPIHYTFIIFKCSLCIVWCLRQNIACFSAGHISALFCFPSDMIGIESWAVWSYCLVLLLGVSCYFLSGWLRAVCFVLQLPGPPVVPLLGNVLLISNHQSEFHHTNVHGTFVKQKSVLYCRYNILETAKFRVGIYTLAFDDEKPCSKFHILLKGVNDFVQRIQIITFNLIRRIFTVDMKSVSENCLVHRFSFMFCTARHAQSLTSQICPM